MDMYKIYELLPQMKTYSEIGYEWKPFIMNTQESKFRSNVVNTMLITLEKKFIIIEFSKMDQ